MKIFVGADHAGFHLKEIVLKHLRGKGFDIEDVGDAELDPADDYPQFAYAAVSRLLSSDDPQARGVLLCGSGQGMCIAANRVPGIRASLCWSETVARETRNDNDSNVLCVPARVVDEPTALKIIDTWIAAEFSGAERHARRIREIEELNPHAR